MPTPEKRLQAALVRRQTISRLRDSLPVPEEEFKTLSDGVSSDSVTKGAQRFDAPIKLIPLDSDRQWESFDNGMRVGAEGNLAPWNRILSILRGLGARTCVVESHYVCLDYRSEVATFYAQLDAGFDRHSIRCHFFSTKIKVDDVLELSPAQQDSYLGYVVCRGGNLPLVGRAVIKAPAYIQTVAAITEPVYFFGQRLAVVGVPFMQQDERFAVCAHVAAWEAHYSAYRRGLVERRLIADFVDQSRGIQPMKPAGSKGLVANQVADLLRETGMRSEVWLTPNAAAEAHYPHLEGSLEPLANDIATSFANSLDTAQGELTLGDTLKTVLSSATDSSIPSDNRDLLRVLLEASQGDQAADTGFGERLLQSSLTEFAIQFHEMAKYSTTLFPFSAELQDLIIRYLVTPYLESRWPIYCDTADHALLMVGVSTYRSASASARSAGTASSEETGRGLPVFFFHDDQFGPYLASRYALVASRDDFKYQSCLQTAAHDSIPEGSITRQDLAPEVISGNFQGQDADRGIHSLVIATPSRLLLDPSAAEASATRLMQESGVPAVDRRRVVILMGTDYKDARLADISRWPKRSTEARSLFASIHLAEWVVVVEGIDGDRVLWECVFDGSSGSNFPLVQLARLGEAVAYLPPGLGRAIELADIEDGKFRPASVPSRIGKGRRPEMHDEERVEPTEALDESGNLGTNEPVRDFMNQLQAIRAVVRSMISRQPVNNGPGAGSSARVR